MSQTCGQVRRYIPRGIVEQCLDHGVLSFVLAKEIEPFGSLSAWDGSGTASGDRAKQEHQNLHSSPSEVQRALREGHHGHGSGKGK